jgi:hypothetical protein
MLVKELRQGMRGKVFVSSFLALQGLMIFAVLTGMTEENEFLDGLFWLVIGGALIFVMPLRGLGSIGTEIRSNTLELVFLTHLSALRIVFGKWFSLVAQSVLFACAVLPYIFIRYFIGGNDVLNELFTLFMMVASSAILISVAVGMSAYLTTWVRIVIFLVTAFFASIAALQALSDAWAYGRGGTVSGWESYIWFTVFGGLILALMLEVGAARIAPPAENHAARKRLIGWLFVAAGPFLFMLGVPTHWYFASFNIVVLLLCLNAVMEEPVYVPALSLPFVRLGAPGVVLGRVLYPGWPSGCIYLVITLLALFLNAAVCNGHEFDEEDISKGILFFAALIGAMLMPLMLTKLVAPDSASAVLNFLWLQLFFSLLTLLVLGIDDVLSQSGFTRPVRDFLAFIPMSTLLLILSDTMKIDSLPTFLICTGAVTLVTLLILAWRAQPHFARMAGMEAAGRELAVTMRQLREREKQKDSPPPAGPDSTRAAS